MTGVNRPLFGFEIYLIEDGWEIKEKSPLNAYHPYHRSYSKNNKTIYFAYLTDKCCCSFFPCGMGLALEKDTFLIPDNNFKYWLNGKDRKGFYD